MRHYQKTKNIVSVSVYQTRKIAGEFARDVLRKRGLREALIVALSGELGTGKTVFVQGFAKELGVRRRITSPTFVLVRRFALYIKKLAFSNLYHIDAYRLRKLGAVDRKRFQEMFTDPQNIILIEWPERMRGILPKGAIKVKMRYGEHQNERIILMNF
ncbi:tRNA (adenosine(37)-N6)-threonylcarbamoyltransferase complex ATPase subunit type 1 TsaE [Candidatus Jorgensenbacteria bacterium RIFCSPLOWO2_01_FULL_45_25b]|uniref:tRNA threonylcarbamoyladenosine biosynthesis protein TsaE n=1 Tax=Candidatus Jorgensenbacteria bacterium RIFCSPLOWO2_01_FULL_45_25b TaxID=1798471 RepID=A0A1F6BUX8_9BACT|nr:MAG: tRNA (adenosine(37)-N6)-threonylcarbamoyltransferase complex ATPase subunit type 1 TsaE [Candidatus Jorgensenbacteria bacterium RIFCSPLOWO2_01_FULL_45_25b]